MNSFLLLLDFLIFSFLSASALASATLPILQGACQPVFNANFTHFLTNCPFFCDNMTEIADNFSTEL